MIEPSVADALLCLPCEGNPDYACPGCSGAFGSGPCDKCGADYCAWCGCRVR